MVKVAPILTSRYPHRETGSCDTAYLSISLVSPLVGSAPRSRTKRPHDFTP
ncbi:hypothetical protein FHS27_004584 [Rhodopirellula rubra]|uniref:Uncharacterized protein n=1 Tax=Aporhodopirellula rubra TaxID=980271 RepID=A0A7W5E215_9BACT|nr:hypothetical protein [Aporhodopirellula rubra]